MDFILTSIDFYNDIFPFLFLSYSFWEAISNTQESVWPHFQNISRFVTNAPLRVVFSTFSRVWTCAQTRSFVFDRLHEILKLLTCMSWRPDDHRKLSDSIFRPPCSWDSYTKKYKCYTINISGNLGQCTHNCKKCQIDV